MSEQLETGHYVPTEAFRAISEHVAVMRGEAVEVGPLVALFGPAGDPQSEADARLFVAAEDLRDAAAVALSAIRGEISPSIAEHALEQALRKAGVNT